MEILYFFICYNRQRSTLCAVTQKIMTGICSRNILHFHWKSYVFCCCFCLLFEIATAYGRRNIKIRYISLNSFVLYIFIEIEIRLLPITHFKLRRWDGSKIALSISNHDNKITTRKWIENVAAKCCRCFRVS